MSKNKKLITEAQADELSDKELENVSGGTEIMDNESIKINNNNFDASINIGNVDASIKINNSNVDMSIKHRNDFEINMPLSNNSDIKILKNN